MPRYNVTQKFAKPTGHFNNIILTGCVSKYRLMDVAFGLMLSLERALYVCTMLFTLNILILQKHNFKLVSEVTGSFRKVPLDFFVSFSSQL